MRVRNSKKSKNQPTTPTTPTYTQIDQIETEVRARRPMHIDSLAPTDRQSIEVFVHCPEVVQKYPPVAIRVVLSVLEGIQEWREFDESCFQSSVKTCLLLSL
jgi:hypothetical protein